MDQPTPPWTEYLKAITGDSSGREISRRLGISDATVSRWFKGTAAPTARQVSIVARAYKQNPLQALIAAGYLTEEEAGVAEQGAPRLLQLRDFSDLELAKEMLRRVAEPGDHSMLEAPLDETHPAMAQYQPGADD